MTGSHEVRGSIPLGSTIRHTIAQRLKKQVVELFFLPSSAALGNADLDKIHRKQIHTIVFIEKINKAFFIFLIDIFDKSCYYAYTRLEILSLVSCAVDIMLPLNFKKWHFNKIPFF